MIDGFEGPGFEIWDAGFLLMLQGLGFRARCYMSLNIEHHAPNPKPFDETPNPQSISRPQTLNLLGADALNLQTLSTLTEILSFNIGALTRIGLWGPLYYKYDEEPPK